MRHSPSLKYGANASAARSRSEGAALRNHEQTHRQLIRRLTVTLRRSLLPALFALTLVLPGAPARADDAKSTSEDPLAPFGRFVGGAWESEGDFRVRVAYEWGLGKKLLKIKSFLFQKDEPRLVYESSVYFHPEKRQVVFQSVSVEGGLFDGVMTPQGNTYESIFTNYKGTGKTEFRQTIEFLDDDHVLWKVFGKEGNEWKLLHDVKEHRVK
jgi:hypothetical protein